VHWNTKVRKKAYLSGKAFNAWQAETDDESKTSSHAIPIQQLHNMYVTLTYPR